MHISGWVVITLAKFGSYFIFGMEYRRLQASSCHRPVTQLHHRDQTLLYDIFGFDMIGRQLL